MIIISIATSFIQMLPVLIFSQEIFPAHTLTLDDFIVHLIEMSLQVTLNRFPLKYLAANRTTH